MFAVILSFLSPELSECCLELRHGPSSAFRSTQQLSPPWYLFMSKNVYQCSLNDCVIINLCTSIVQNKPSILCVVVFGLMSIGSFASLPYMRKKGVNLVESCLLVR